MIPKTMSTQIKGCGRYFGRFQLGNIVDKIGEGEQEFDSCGSGLGMKSDLFEDVIG